MFLLWGTSVLRAKDSLCAMGSVHPLDPLGTCGERVSAGNTYPGIHAGILFRMSALA